MEENYECWRENLRLEQDIANFQQELKAQQNKYARMLLGDMGKDMREVLNGEKKIRISPLNNFMFKVKCFFNNMFNKI